MIRNNKIFGALALAFVLAAGLATAGVLYAQKAGGMGGRMGMMPIVESCPMMHAMQQSPQAALEHRKELELADAQVRQLQALEEEAEQVHARAMEQMMALHEEIGALGNGETFDEAAARAAFERMGDLHTEVGVAMLRTRHDVRQVLTAEQSDELAELGGGMMGMHGMMQGMHGGMMGGVDMKDCPTMQGGMMKGTGGSEMHRPHHPRS